MEVRQSRKRLAVGGVAGPVAFVAAWAILGARQGDYSPVDDPISRLAAIGSSSRPPMTAGILALGVGVGAYAGALRAALGGPAAVAAGATAVATFGIAATPLESSLGGTPHAVAAGVAYATLAGTPFLAGRTLADGDARRLGRASMLTGLLSGAALLTSVLAPPWTGLFQRLGLTIGHAWIVASAVWMLRATRSARPRSPSRPRRPRSPA